jgi:hypothetical protein
MAENDEEKRIVISVDRAAADASLKAIKSLEKETQNLGKELKTLGKGSSDYASELRKSIREQNAAASSAGKLTSEIKEQAGEAKKTVGIIESLAGKYKELKSSSSGGIGGNVADIRGSISTITGGAANQGLELASGVGDAVEAFGSLNPAALAATAAIGALSLVMGNYTKEAEKQAQALNSVIDAQRSVGQQVAQGLTSEDATARLAEVNRLREEEQALLERQKAAYQEAMDALGGLGFVAQQIAPQEQALADQIAASEAAIAGYNSEISALNTRLGDGSIAANDTAAAEEELARTREQDAQRSIAQTEAANQRILALNEQRDSAIENRLIARSNAAQSTKLESGFAEEDEKAELTKHLADLQAIRETGYQKELALAKEIADLPAQQAKDLGAVTTKGTKELQKLNDDYFANQIKATKDFAKESGRINQEVAKNARRIAEDLADRLSDAARDNDVVAFLQAEKEGQKELRRNAEDAKDAEKQRQEDFLDQQEEQRQAYNQRQQEILRQVEEEKQKVIQSYAEKRQALEQQIQQERANTQQAIANAQARYQQEEALEDQQAKRNAQRLQLRDQQEQAAFQRSLNAINSKVNAELQGLARIQQAAMSLGSSMSSKSNYGKPAPSQYVSPYANGQPSSGGGFGSKGGINVNVSMSNNVGDVASMTALNAASNQIQQNVQQAVMRAVQGAQG